MKNIIKIFFLAISFSLLSLSYQKNEICCMFGANRYFGYPEYMLSIYKTTDDYDEAQKVNYLSTSQLLKQGRQINFNTIYGSGINGIIINFLFYFAIIYSLNLIYLLSQKHIKKTPN